MIVTVIQVLVGFVLLVLFAVGVLVALPYFHPRDPCEYDYEGDQHWKPRKGDKE